MDVSKAQNAMNKLAEAQTAAKEQQQARYNPPSPTPGAEAGWGGHATQVLTPCSMIASSVLDGEPSTSCSRGTCAALVLC